MHYTNLTAFTTDLCDVNWNSIKSFLQTNSKYETFFKILSELYEKNFPLKDLQIKAKNIQVSWLSKRTKKIL